jgi:autotransporter-associated beta strand protein
MRSVTRFASGGLRWISTLFLIGAANAQDATWVGYGGYGYAFGNPANWTPNIVPTGTATFGNSSSTAIWAGAGYGGGQLGTLEFTADAPEYQFSGIFTLTGAGIIDNSPYAPVFSPGLPTRSPISALNFKNSSTAGDAQVFNIDDTCECGLVSTTFYDTSTAASSSITNEGGNTVFRDRSTAGTALITNNYYNGMTLFYDSSTAGHSNILVGAGAIKFYGASTAGNAVIRTINEASSLVMYFDQSTGGDAQLEMDSPRSVVDFSLTTGPNGDGKLSAGSIAGIGSFLLGSNELTVGTNDLSTTVGGIVADGGASGRIGGALVKTGNGTLTLSGNNTYTGPTTVNGGAIQVDGSIAASSGVQVNAGGVLAGAGIVPKVVVAGGGAVSPGDASAGTLTVQGSLILSPGAVYAYDLSGSAADLLNVGGAANLSGTLLVHPSADLVFNHRFVVLATTGGVSGTFSDVTGFGPGITATVGYDANDVTLMLEPESVVQLLPSRPTNLVNLAHAIDDAVLNFGAYPVFEPLYELSPADLDRTLSQMSGVLGASVMQVGPALSTPFLDALLDHDGFRGSAAPFEGSAITRVAFAGPASETPLATNSTGVLHFWSDVHGSWSNHARDDSMGTPAAQTTIGGFAFGTDYRADSDTVIGAAIGFGQAWWHLKDDVGSGRTGAVQVGLYGWHRFEGFYVATAVAYSASNTTTSRTLVFSGYNAYRAHIHGENAVARFEIGRRIAVCDDFGLAPYFAWTLQEFDAPSYMEQTISGSPSFALHYADKSHDDVMHDLGFTLDRRIKESAPGGTYLQMRIGWLHRYSGVPGVFAGFPAIPGLGFTSFGIGTPSNAAHVSALAEGEVADRLWLTVSTSSELSGKMQSYDGNAAIAFRW